MAAQLCNPLRALATSALFGARHFYQDPVTSESVFTRDPRSIYEPSVGTRRLRDIVLASFSLAADGALPRTSVRGLLTSGAAVATLHFAGA